MRARLLIGLAVAVLAVPVLPTLSDPALAQPNAGALLNQQERQQGWAHGQLPPPEVSPKRPALRRKGEVSVLVKSVRFSGDTDLMDEAKLRKVVAYAIGQRLDFTGLDHLARQVTDALRRHGWLLAKAYLPRQDVTTGNIEIVIRAGHLDGRGGKGSPFRVKLGGTKKPRIKRQRLEAIAGNLLPAGASVRDKTLERTLLLMNDLPGVAARARLRKGVTPDSTQVLIIVEEGPAISGSGWVDNYGNYSTGTSQGNISGQINDPGGIGDQIIANATLSEGLSLLRLGYSLPLGSHGLRLAAAGSAMKYRVVRGPGEAGGLDGTADTAGATLTYPFIRSRRLNLYSNTGFTYRQLKDEATAGTLDDKRVKVWSAGFAGDVLDTIGGGGLTSWSATWSTGRLDLSHDEANARADAAGYDTQGSYNKLDYNLARLQKLPGRFTLFANLSGQVATDNLDSSEQLILGGPYGVRAYPVGEASGDEGWLSNFELRYDLPGTMFFGQWQLMTFYDAGSISLHHDPKDIPIATATGRNHYTLSDWGLGAVVRQTGLYMVRLLWADTLGSNPGRTVTGKDVDDHAHDSRLWVQATVWF